MDKQSLPLRDKAKLQTLKGFRDFLPDEAKKRQYVLEIITKTFELFGFEPLETPSLEYQELLLGKYGEEADKLVYKFNDLGGRGVALRYDQTVPTARVLATYNQKLALPFRRYQIQNVWRAEKPQSGRFREFLQCDADIFGSSSPLSDSEVIALSYTVFKKLGFTDFSIIINDRNILYELMKYASIPESLHMKSITAIDKLDRIDKSQLTQELITSGLNEDSINHLFHHLEEAEPTPYLKNIMKISENLGVEKGKILFQARLARGLDYYTSTIFEMKIKGYKGGSVLGGGRYDELIGKLSGVDIPAVGFALGFDRVIEAMQENNLFPDEGKRRGTLVAVFNSDFIEISASTVEKLRGAGIEAEIFPDENSKLERQLKYADKKNIKWFIVIGPEEAEKGSAILKDLETGHQEDMKTEVLIKKVASSQ